MGATNKVQRAVGWVLHALIGALMIFAGAGKLFGFAPAPIVEALTKGGLGNKVQLIGAGETLTAILLLIPRTSSPGLLLASAFWGGVICFHMTQGDGYAPGAILLALTWVGAFLRDPRTLGRLSGVPSSQLEVQGPGFGAAKV